jgi:hypothetical protein
MYINSFCSISPAGVLTNSSSSALPEPLSGPMAACQEPDYKELIPVMQLRRMTKPVRTGVAAARLCLQPDSKLPDAIHVGTAYGMLQDSENFLQKMIAQDEQMLNPTAFIQSTHNTVAGQIALSMGCNAHNMTYVHKAHSFESALLDAALMLEDHPGYNLLAGSVDECTETSYAILQRFGVYHDRNTAGEGAAFFTLSSAARSTSLASITAFDMLTAAGPEMLEAHWAKFREQHQLTPAPGDLFLNGIPADFNPAALGFTPAQTINYKQYCGEYPTAITFALALASLLLAEHKAGRCWIGNGFGRHYSFWCLDRP